MKNLAILVDTLGHSQKFRDITQSLNRLDNSINATVFYCEPGIIPNPINFPVMEIMYSYIFNGVVVATDIYTAQVMENILGTTGKYYYPWDLEYVYQPYPMQVLKTVFDNKLIARNKARYDILKSTWHEPELIIEDFNVEQLERLFKT